MFAQHALRFRISLPVFAQFVECDVYIFVHRLELIYCDEQQLGVSDGESHPSELSFRFRLPHSICDAHCERLFVAFAVCHALSRTLGLAVAVVMISGWMRQLHTGPNIISAGDGGVLIEIQPGLQGSRDRGEQTDGQEGQEADRGAAAEDREAPATAGRGEEAAR